MRCRKCGGHMMLYSDWGLRWVCNDCGNIVDALEKEAKIISLDPRENSQLINDPPEKLREEKLS